MLDRFMDWWVGDGQWWRFWMLGAPLVAVVALAVGGIHGFLPALGVIMASYVVFNALLSISRRH